MRALLAVLLLALPAAAALDLGGAPARLAVGFDHPVGPADLAALQARGAVIARAPAGADYAVVHADPAALRGLPGVRFVEADPPLALEEAPNDLFWNDLGPWQGQWGPKAIGAEAAWDLAPGSGEVVVAVLDTGVDWLHPELRDAVWVNAGEVPDNGVDDDGNGYVDDVRGWDCADDDNDPRGGSGVANSHGTHVAGIVAARRDNLLGTAGMAEVKVMALKVFGMDSLASAAAECAAYAVANGARILGMSWGTTPSTPLTEALQDAWAAGAVLVKSAGNANGGAVTYPGTLPEVIAVSALDPPGDVVASYSSRGDKVELAAPGTRILSTLQLGNAVLGAPPDPPLLAYFTGTSMAQPHVAGVAALMLGKNPALTNQQVRDLLGATADDLGPPGRDPASGFGRVDAHAAVLASGP